MKLVYSKKVAEQKDVNQQLRQIRRQKYVHNTEQKKIFEHLARNNLQLDLKKKQHIKILSNGIPQIYRQVVWPQLFKNNHGVTPKLYETLLKKVIKITTEIIEVQKSEEAQEQLLNKAKSEGYAPSQQINLSLQKISKWLETIKLDIPRTFSELKIFQSFSSTNNPNQELIVNNQSCRLFNLLSSWVVYRDDIGYRQGMSHVAGYLFIELNNQVKAFQIFCSLVTNDTLYEFYTMNIQFISLFCSKVHAQLKERNSEVYNYLNSNQVDYKLFVLDWMFSLFTKCFQLDTIGKVWDLILLNQCNEQILMYLIVEIIVTFEEQILGYFDNNNEPDGMEVCRFLKKAKVCETKQDRILNSLKDLRK